MRSVGNLKYRPEITQRENILSTVQLWQRRLLAAAAVVATYVVEAARLSWQLGVDSNVMEARLRASWEILEREKMRDFRRVLGAINMVVRGWILYLNKLSTCYEPLDK